MKAVLVIDMPHMCNECPMCSADTGFWGDITRSECRITKRDNLVYLDGMVFPEWCPLKLMPQKMRTDEDDIEVDSYYQGWNDCLEEIE